MIVDDVGSQAGVPMIELDLLALTAPVEQGGAWHTAERNPKQRGTVRNWYLGREQWGSHYPERTLHSSVLAGQVLTGC